MSSRSGTLTDAESGKYVRTSGSRCTVPAMGRLGQSCYSIVWQKDIKLPCLYCAIEPRYNSHVIYILSAFILRSLWRIGISHVFCKCWMYTHVPPELCMLPPC